MTVRHIVLCVGLLPSFLGYAWADSGLTIADIETVAESVRQGISAVDVTYQLEQEYVGRGAAPEHVSRTRERLLLDLNSGAYLKYTQMPNSDGQMVERAEAQHGGSRMVYEPGVPSAIIQEPIEGHLSKRILKSAAVLRSAMMLPPRPDGAGLNDGNLTSLLKRGILRPATEQVDGRTCHVVDAFVEHDGADYKYVTAWLDVDRGAIPLRLVSYSDREGTIGMEQMVLSAAQFSDSNGRSIWWPTKIQTNTTVQHKRFRITQTVDVERTEYNPSITPESFSIDLPPGTVIYDEVAGHEYSVPGVAFPDTRDLGRAVEREGRQGDRRRLISIWIVNIGLLSAIVSWWYRGRKKIGQVGS